MPMDNVTLENTQQSISSRDAKSVASVMVNGKWVNLSDTLEQANVKSDVGTVAKQVAAQQEVVSNAASTADSAVAYANDAIEKSRVNSQAIVDINSAVSDAVSGAAVARSDGLRALNAAQSNADLIDSNYASASAAISSARTEAVAAADDAKKSASAAQADIVAVRSDVAVVQADVTATKSDVAVAKSAIADTKTSLTSQAKSLSSYAAQASANGADIVTLKSQAGQLEQDMASTKGDVSQLKVSASSASVALSDATGNISSLQATAKSYSAALSDTNSNVASVTATASELETKYADVAGDISQIKTDAKGMTQTISDAQGDIAKLKTRADGFDTQFADINGNINKLQTDATGTKQTLTNAKSDIAVLQSRADGFDTKYADAAGDINTLKADASGFSQTLTDAKGDISTLQATATGFKNTLTDAQGNISTLQSDVAGLKRTTSDHAGDIATLQADAKTLTSQISSAQGDISTLNQTASGISSKVTANSTAIEQNKNAIALKAAQTDVDTLKGTVSQNTATLKTQADQIQSKVSASDVSGMLAGYATQSYAQSLVTQTADKWNLNLTKLQTDVNAIKTTGGGVNLLQGTRDFSGINIKGGKVAVTNGGESFQAAFGTQNSSQSYFDLVSFNSIPLEKDTDYTASFWVKTSEDTDIWSFLYDSGSNGVYADEATVNHSTTDYTRIVVHFHNGNNNATPNFIPVRINKNSTITVWVYGCMLEKGTVAYDWSPSPSDMATVTSVTNLSATVDGIKSTVATKADQSTVTQLSNLVQTKVSSGDFTSTTTQLKNMINQRVQVGDVISQINEEAGGNTLIQVSNGKGKLALNASSVVFSGSAFIPDAYISTLNADKLMFYGSDGTYATMGASVAQYDDDNQKSTINLQYNGGIEIHSSNQQGSILTMHDNTIRLASKSWGDNPNAYQYSGFYAAPNYSLMNTYHRDGTTSGVAIDDNQIHIYGSSKDQQLGALQADVGWYSINGKTGLLTGDQITLKSASTQATLTDRNINIANTIDTNDKNYDVAIHIKGWAEMTGWFTCMGITQTSLLSTKTRIEPLDTKVALDKIVSANVNTYQFKTDVAKGKTKRHASVIIDDVHDVAEYYTPEEFISEDRMGRDDGDIIGYLMGAVQELTKRIKTLESKVG